MALRSDPSFALVCRSYPQAARRGNQTHIETVRDLLRRFHRQGLRGLVPDDVAIVPKGKTTRVPQAVVDELARLKALYAGFQYRELARIILQSGLPPAPPDRQKALGGQSRGRARELALGAYHSHAEPYQPGCG